METKNIFEVASREKLRFNYKGQLSAEDLWDLKDTDLDAIYKALRKQQRDSEEESLLSTKTTADKTTELQIEIVTYVLRTKQQEQQERVKLAEEARLRKNNNDAIDAVIRDKELEELKGKSLADLKALRS